MSYLLQLIEDYGLLAVFLNVLIEQGGAPVPAYPTLVLTGALAAQGKFDVYMLLAVAVLGAFMADMCWYYAGRRYGRRVMALLCRLSLSPDSCVRQTENAFVRWGAPSLLIAKFIPGFGSVASALAGSTRTRLADFILFDLLGAALWTGSAIYLGSLFSTTVDDLLNVLQQFGKGGILLIAMALTVFLGAKWWQRRVYLRSMRMARISAFELHGLLQNGGQPLIVDVRSPLMRNDGKIPGSISVGADITQTVGGIAADAEIVLYCACPNDATAAKVAAQLMKSGFTKVRPLHGGVDAWRTAGYALESSPLREHATAP